MQIRLEAELRESGFSASSGNGNCSAFSEWCAEFHAPFSGENIAVIPAAGTPVKGQDIVVHEVIREAREGALIELTDKLATVALAPLTRSTAATLEELAQEVARIAGVAKHA